jgi:hypothetical protein
MFIIASILPMFPIFPIVRMTVIAPENAPGGSNQSNDAN